MKMVRAKSKVFSKENPKFILMVTKESFLQTIIEISHPEKLCFMSYNLKSYMF